MADTTIEYIHETIVKFISSMKLNKNIDFNTLC